MQFRNLTFSKPPYLVLLAVWTPCTVHAASEAAITAIRLSSTPLSISVLIHTVLIYAVFKFFSVEDHLPLSALWEYLPTIGVFSNIIS